MSSAGPRPRPHTFAPRITLLLIAGVLVFLLVAGLYALPVLLEPAPPGAIVDYHKERVLARLRGKVPWLLLGSMLATLIAGARFLRAGAGRGRRP